MSSCFFTFSWGEEQTPVEGVSGKNTISARRILVQKIQDGWRATLSAQQKKDWAEAWIALIALERLIGNEKEALVQFKKCGEQCRDWIRVKEWQDLVSWACKREKWGGLCKKNTKAQTPPQ